MSTRPIEARSQTNSIPRKKEPSSNAAVSGASDPCVALRPIDWPKSRRNVPGSALAGSVGPIVSRHFWIAFGAPGAEQHARPPRHEPRHPAENRPLAMPRVEPSRLALGQVLQPHRLDGEP